MSCVRSNQSAVPTQSKAHRLTHNRSELCIHGAIRSIEIDLLLHRTPGSTSSPRSHNATTHTDLVILGEAPEVRRLHLQQVVARRLPDAHHGCCGRSWLLGAVSCEGVCGLAVCCYPLELGGQCRSKSNQKSVGRPAQVRRGWLGRTRGVRQTRPRIPRLAGHSALLAPPRRSFVGASSSRHPHPQVWAHPPLAFSSPAAGGLLLLSSAKSIRTGSALDGWLV